MTYIKTSKRTTKNNQNKKAFTLIELSIVMIIIGLIVTGIVAGKSLVDVAKVAGAKSLTNTSPVSTIENLALWLDASNEENFNKDATNLVDTWFDSNTQSLPRVNSTASGDARPTYVTDGINGIPALSFDGVDDVLDMNFLFQKSANDGWTILIVFKNVGISGLKSIFGARVSAGNDIITFRTDGTNREFFHTKDSLGVTAVICCNTTIDLGNVYIFTAVNNGLLSERRAYMNGQLLSTATTAGDINTSPYSVYLGAFNQSGTSASFGEINVGEFIMFDKSLSDLQRGEVEKYLSDKWAIALQ